MGMVFTGIIKYGGVYEVTSAKDRSKQVMISFTAVDELGTAYSFQMWPDDPQHAQLAQVFSGGNVRRQPVQLDVVSYTVRMRKFKDGTEKPQANFIVTNVRFPNPNYAAGPNGAAAAGVAAGV